MEQSESLSFPLWLEQRLLKAFENGKSWGVPQVSRLCKRSVLAINRCAAVVVINHISYRELRTCVEVCACILPFYILKVRTELFPVAIMNWVGVNNRRYDVSVHFNRV